MTEQMGIVGILLAAIGALWKIFIDQSKRIDEERKTAYNQLIEQNRSEIGRLIEELDNAHEERITEREEFLRQLDKRDESLRENTEVLKMIAEKIEAVPTIQKEVEGLKSDVKEIKDCIGSKC